MKIPFYVPLIFLLGLGVTQKNLSPKEVSEDYFKARNSFSYSKVKDLISDSLTVIEGDYSMYYSQDSYYEVFKWDSIFQTSYEIAELEEAENQVIASVTLSSIRNSFLKNEQMTCQFRLSFESGKISKIESLDCKDANWEIWEERVSVLVQWIEENHPELNGFIYDMSMEGAKNYIRAIELFESQAKIKSKTK